MECHLHVTEGGEEVPCKSKKKSPATAGTDRRTDTRLRVNIPVELTWNGSTGHRITERTFVEDISDFGCRFSIRETVKQGDLISVQLLSMNGRIVSGEGPKAFKIMWVSRKPTGMTVGARLQEADQLDNTNTDLGTEISKPPAK